MRFRKKPVVIDAVQWLGNNKAEVEATFPEWLEDDDFPDGSPIVIDTLEGEMRCDVDDWIIKGVKGEFYPCKPDIFAATYDPADGEGCLKQWTVKTTEHIETVTAAKCWFSPESGFLRFTDDRSEDVAWFLASSVICVVPSD